MTQAIARNVQEGYLSKGHIISVRILVYAFTCLSLMMVSRVVGAEIIPQDRRIAWAPGVPGGIPYYPTFSNVKSSPYNAVGDGIADDTAAIQSAVNGCPEGRAVLLPQGTYRVTNTISIRSRIVLRGEGPGKTRIIQANSSGDVIWMGRSTSLGSAINLQTDALKNMTQLSLVSTAGLASGDYLVLSQLNKPGLVTDQGYDGVCTWCGNDESERSMTQIIPIASVAGNVVNLAKPVYFTFSTGLSAQVRKIDLLMGAGIEDLYIEQLTTQSGARVIAMIYLSRSWVKNVESYNAGGTAHVLISLSFGCEIRDSYFHEAHDYSSGRGYGILLFGWNSDHLIENNIIRKTRHSMIMSGGSGCVFGYNYCIDVYTQPDTNFLSEDASTHGAHPFMNLFEGNVFAKLSFDNTWGSGSHNTAFRNHITASSPGTVYGVVAVDVEKNNYYINMVGNVLGALGANFDPWRLGYSTPGTGSSSDDPQVISTLLRHGNVDNRSGQTEWDSGIPDHNLPDSYYLSERPGFSSGFAWPAIGPDYGVGVIPAQARYEGTIVGIPPAPPQRLRIVN